LTESQRLLYTEFCEDVQLRQVVCGVINNLAALTLMKKLCDQPTSLGKNLEHFHSLKLQPRTDLNDLIEESTKLQFISKLFVNLKENVHKVVVFSQSLKILDTLQQLLTSIGLKFGELDESLQRHLEYLHSLGIDRITPHTII